VKVKSGRGRAVLEERRNRNEGEEGKRRNMEGQRVSCRPVQTLKSLYQLHCEETGILVVETNLFVA